MTNVFVSIRSVTKKFGSLTAVDDLSFDINEGEVVGVLGPNGAGKSTLMYMLTTVYRPTDGTIYIGGYDVMSSPTRVRNLVGIAFQDPKLDRFLKVSQILEWHAEIVGIPSEERNQRVDTIVRSLELTDHTSKRSWGLSGGLKKKVEDAKVFIQRPKLAIFDEPTAFLDLPSRKTVWNMIRELREEGSTVILATNMMDEAEANSDRVLVLHQGRKVASGTPDELMKKLPGREIISIKLDIDKGQTVVDAIKTVQGVQEAWQQGNDLTLYVHEGESLVPSIVATLAAHDLKLESIRVRKVTLEDVFMSYTKASLH